MLANDTRRADIQAASSTTIQFAATTALAVRPIRLWAPSGRQAALVALPTAHTISGTAGTRYLYGSLAAPSGDPYSTASGGILDKILSALAWNRSDWFNGFRAFHPGDGTLIDPARNSAVTFVETGSATPPDTHHVPLGECEVVGGEIKSVVSYEGQTSVTVSALIHGQCKLLYSLGDLVLQPLDGFNLVIGGVARSVVAFPTLPPTGLTPDTLYLIYAYWTGSAVALEASTTGHAFDAATGVRTKSGDTTRTLVGMGRIITGPAWVDTESQRLVRSWFHDSGISGRAALTADRTSTSVAPTFTPLHAEMQVDVLLWQNEFLHAACSGEVQCSTEAQGPLTGISVDSTTTPEPGVTNSEANEDARPRPASVTIIKAGLAEGFHSVRVLGAVTAAATGTWEGTTSPRQFALAVWTLRR